MEGCFLDFFFIIYNDYFLINIFLFHHKFLLITAMSPEHDAVKLQRRTSYLMATARERTELSLPVQHPLDRLTTATHALDSM